MSDKLTGLQRAKKATMDKYGREAIVQAEAIKTDVIGTGSFLLDMSLGTGGWPRGRLIELYGSPSCGKSTLAMTAAVQCQRLGEPVLYLDFEHAFDPSYAGRIGIGFKNEEWVLAQPSTMEEGLGIAETFIEEQAVGLIVVDSLAAMTPSKILDGEIGDSHVAVQAKLMAECLQRLTGKISISNVAVIFVNHVRDVIGGMPGRHPRKTTPGGNALKFYASVRTELTVIESIAGKIEDFITGKLIDGPIAVKVRAMVVKNKLATPYRQATFFLDMSGIAEHRTVLEIAEGRGLIKRNGSRYVLPFKTDSDKPLNLGGQAAVIAWMKDNPTRYKLLRDKVVDLVTKTSKQAEVTEPQPDQTASGMEVALSEGVEGDIDFGAEAPKDSSPE